MKVELTDKEIEIIGRERYSPKSNKLWYIWWCVFCALMFLDTVVAKAFNNNVITSVASVFVLIITIGMVIIIQLKINKAGKEFLAQCKKDTQETLDNSKI